MPTHNERSESSLKAPWLLSAAETAERLEVDLDEGLSSAEADKRLSRYGPNRIRATRRRSAWKILFDQLKNFIVLLLAAAAALSFFFGQMLEAIAILAVIVINTLIGFFTELKATRSMEALREMSRVTAKVIREGKIHKIASEDLVPGDLLFLEGGDVVTADLRLSEASRLRIDESALTGESVPADKQVEAEQEEVPLAERRNMAYKGTAVTSGSGHGVVVATGMDTELGRISSMAEAAESEQSPLEQRITRLGYKLIVLTLLVSMAIVVSGMLTGMDLFLIVQTAIALAVAAIPEGLPIVATIALARGMWRMARRNAVMHRLSAVETLGSTSVIFTDKTGTLTENRMIVRNLALSSGPEPREIHVDEKGAFHAREREIKPLDDPLLRRILENGVLCNNASLPRPAGEFSLEDLQGAVGDPLEAALLAVGAQAGMDRSRLLEQYPEAREVAFETRTKMMATYHRSDKGFRVAVKGAPEAVLAVCSGLEAGQEDGPRPMDDRERRDWQERSNAMAGSGLRVLAMAAKTAASQEEKPYEELTFLGLVGMLDPPREGIERAISACRDAGIQAVMITGDHVETAKNIARRVGMIEGEDPVAFEGKEIEQLEQEGEERRARLRQAKVFARVSPKQKLDLIALHQERKAVVAMTGDGVNDAPALKKADIGIAMGRRGTQVAREASDMVLKDDAFSTIVAAIQQGRTIFDNIRKFILFLLSGNVGEILIVTAALLMGMPLPILPLQILYLNMIGDVFPALALGVGRGDESKMQRPPRSQNEGIMTGKHWWAVMGYGVVIAAAVLAAFYIALFQMHLETSQAVTVSFLTLSFARLWHVFNMRDPDGSFFRNDVTLNPFVWGALLLCTGLLLFAVYLPFLAGVLKLETPGLNAWLFILAMSLVPFVVIQAAMLVFRYGRRPASRQT